jgi:hypothetical protein
MPFHRPKVFRTQRIHGHSPSLDNSESRIRWPGANKDAIMTIMWGDLTEEEQTALKRMNRGPYPALSKALAERLVWLGLAEERPRGTGINRTGRELVINTLLGARPE